MTNPAAYQVNSNCRRNQQKRKGHRDKVRDRVIDRAQTGVTWKELQHPGHERKYSHVDQCNPCRAPTEFRGACQSEKIDWKRGGRDLIKSTGSLLVRKTVFDEDDTRHYDQHARSIDE